jgi:hypothetical protein
MRDRIMADPGLSRLMTVEQLVRGLRKIEAEMFEHYCQIVEDEARTADAAVIH